MKKFLYSLTQCLWGLPQTLAGFVLFLANIRKKHYCYHGAIITEWDSLSSVSLGLFLFVTKERIPAVRRPDPDSRKKAGTPLVVHEYGHTVQSLILGPLYLPVVGLPSLLWANRKKYVRMRMKGTPYSAFWTERTANMLGEMATKDISFRDNA